MNFTKEIRFKPAFDKRHADPSKNYGIHGVELAFYLTGDKGTVQFVVYTNWQLKHVQEEFDKGRPNMSDGGKWVHLSCHPMPADIGYHSPVPRYKGQTPISQKCDFIDGPCYYDGSGLNAEPIYWRLVSEGDKAVWEEMESYYKSYLEEDLTPRSA